MLILSSISSGLEFWSVNDTSIYENSKLKRFKNIKCFSEISRYWRNDLLKRIYYKSIQDSCILLIIVVNNITIH